MRAILPILLATTLTIFLVPSASAGVDVCGDHNVNVDGDVVYGGSMCQDGHVTVCDPLAPAKCWTYSWCHFCPGPVLF